MTTGNPKQKEVNRQNRVQGKKSEVEFAAVTGMTLQLGSGCGRVQMEDLVDSDNLGQVKSSRGKSVSVKVVDIERLVQHASDAGKKPVFFIGFESADPLLMPRKWAMVPLGEWKKRIR